ncbi:intradiol ring-cleavage dioxygenase [Aspergillus undulatus]|uniref:intradiol ring-cleavage dioxygenase n=1 Tax=Aspergillus undulatus TaxID=1810928 RepID=UPI003CCCEAEB
MAPLATFLTLGLAGLSNIVSAHPGHDVRREAAERAAFMQSAPVTSRSLGHCASKLKARSTEDINIARRESAVHQLREARNLSTEARYLKARDTDSVLATDHYSNLTGVTPFTDPKVLFASEGTCIVQPEVTQGPYYISGELIRKEVAEDQQGVPLFMDIQLIDTNTCNPLPDVYADIWHCNATGVYSGVVQDGNGDTSDKGNINETFLRGVQRTDLDGIVQFASIFPGHYSGRATHIHVVTHPANETRALPNGTISGTYDSRSSHVGQIYFDQDLITEVEKTVPYTSNTQELTKNSDDSLLPAEAETTDPFMEYVFLGDDISDGVFAWISIGIDAKRDVPVSPEGFWTEDGGVVNDDFVMGTAGVPSAIVASLAAQSTSA